MCTGHNYGGWFFHYIESQGRWNHFGSLGYLLEFPTGQDGATFWDKGTEVPSLSRDKGTMGQAKNIAKGRDGMGQPKSGTGRDTGQNGTEQKKMF